MTAPQTKFTGQDRKFTDKKTKKLMIATRKWHDFVEKNYRDVQAIVYRYLTKHGGYSGPLDSDYIRDWTHHTLLDLRSYQTLKKYKKQKGKFSTYIFRCVVNAILRRVREEKRQHQVPQPIPDAYDERPELLEKLREKEFAQFLEHHPQKYTAVYKALLSGRTIAETADVLDRSVSWTYGQHWGLQYLYRCYTHGYTGAIKDVQLRSLSCKTKR